MLNQSGGKRKKENKRLAGGRKVADVQGRYITKRKRLKTTRKEEIQRKEKKKIKEKSRTSIRWPVSWCVSQLSEPRLFRVFFFSFTPPTLLSRFTFGCIERAFQAFPWLHPSDRWNSTSTVLPETKTWDWVKRKWKKKEKKEQLHAAHPQGGAHR